MSGGIRKLVEMANDAGLQSDDSAWSEAFVYWFDNLMPEDIRQAGNADSSIEYFDSERTPHTPAGEGFIDRQSRTAISFLLQAIE